MWQPFGGGATTVGTERSQRSRTWAGDSMRWPGPLATGSTNPSTPTGRAVLRHLIGIEASTGVSVSSSNPIARPRLGGAVYPEVGDTTEPVGARTWAPASGRVRPAGVCPRVARMAQSRDLTHGVTLFLEKTNVHVLILVEHAASG